MSILVKMHVFSGRENPVWALSDEQIGELKRIANRSKFQPIPESSTLGYTGFSIVDPSENGDPEIFEMFGDQSSNTDISGSFVSGEPEIEEFLLSTGKEFVEDDIVDVVKTSIENDVSILENLATSCPPNGGANAPSYNPGYWNNNPTRLRRNNCYNYANNQATNTFAQPGRGSGQILTSLKCGNVEAAAKRDGLVSIGSFQSSRPGWYTALVIWPGRDYHWYRQDKNGCWSHKPGSTPAKNTDNSGNRIADPQTSDRGPYTNFCTYMVTKSGVRIG